MTHFAQPFGVCDVCNDKVTDEEFNALGDLWHFPGYLYCKKCFDKYRPDKEPTWECIRKYNKGDNIRDDNLATGITVTEASSAEDYLDD